MPELPPQVLDFNHVPVSIVQDAKPKAKSKTNPTRFTKYETLAAVYAPDIFGPQPQTPISIPAIESILAANQAEAKLQIPEGMEQTIIPTSIQSLIKEYRKKYDGVTTFPISSDTKLKLHPSLTDPKVTVELKF